MQHYYLTLELLKNKIPKKVNVLKILGLKFHLITKLPNNLEKP